MNAAELHAQNWVLLKNELAIEGFLKPTDGDDVIVGLAVAALRNLRGQINDLMYRFDAMPSASTEEEEEEVTA